MLACFACGGDSRRNSKALEVEVNDPKNSKKKSVLKGTSVNFVGGSAPKILSNSSHGIYLNISGKATHFEDAAPFELVPGLSNPECMSFRHLHNEDLYLSYTGDFQTRDVRFQPVVSKKRRSAATFIAFLTQENHVVFRCLWEKCKYYLAYDYDIDHFCLKTVEECSVDEMCFDTFRVEWDHNEPAVRVFPVPMESEPKRRTTWTAVSFLSPKEASGPANCNGPIDLNELQRQIRLPSFGGSLRMTVQATPDQFLARDGSMKERHHSARIVINEIEDNLHTIELSNKPGVFLNVNKKSGAIARFSLKGSIGDSDYKTFILHKNYFGEFTGIETTTEGTPDGFFLKYNPNTNQVQRQLIPANPSPIWKDCASWKFDNNRQAGLINFESA